MSQFNFDASQVAPAAAPEPVPAGNYKANVSQAEMEPTKDATGQMLKLEWTIIEGQYTGRKIYDRLNLVNRNQQAVEIAFGTLSAICRAIGQIRINDTSELIGKPCGLEVDVRPAEGNYGPQNRIKKYHSLSGVPLEQIGGMPGGAAAAPPSWVPPGAAVTAPAPVQGQPNWAQGSPQLAPPPSAAPAYLPPAAPVPIKRLTAKAAGATIEQFQAQGWTEEQMIQQGFLEVVSPPVPLLPTAPPIAPAPPAPVAPAQPWQPPQQATAPTAAGSGPRPPWMGPAQ